MKRNSTNCAYIVNHKIMTLMLSKSLYAQDDATPIA